MDKSSDAFCKLAYIVREAGFLSTKEIEHICSYAYKGGTVAQKINRGRLLLELEGQKSIFWKNLAKGRVISGPRV